MDLQPCVVDRALPRLRVFEIAPGQIPVGQIQKARQLPVTRRALNGALNKNRPGD